MGDTVCPVEQQADIPVSILVDGVPARAHTRMGVFSPYVVVLDTTLPDYGIELHSTYLGHPLVKTRASHLVLAPTVRETLTSDHEHDAIPVLYGRQRCLYDHLARLQDLFHRLNVHAQTSLGEEALTVVQP
jgi:hypothetical protein